MTSSTISKYISVLTSDVKYNIDSVIHRLYRDDYHDIHKPYI